MNTAQLSFLLILIIIFPGNNSMSLAYFEIARYINVYKKLALTVQYNDGL
jgi:hypothetical protein